MMYYPRELTSEEIRIALSININYIISFHFFFVDKKKRRKTNSLSKNSDKRRKSSSKSGRSARSRRIGEIKNRSKPENGIFESNVYDALTKSQRTPIVDRNTHSSTPLQPQKVPRWNRVGDAWPYQEAIASLSCIGHCREIPEDMSEAVAECLRKIFTVATIYSEEYYHQKMRELLAKHLDSTKEEREKAVDAFNEKKRSGQVIGKNIYFLAAMNL